MLILSAVDGHNLALSCHSGKLTKTINTTNGRITSLSYAICSTTRLLHCAVWASLGHGLVPLRAAPRILARWGVRCSLSRTVRYVPFITSYSSRTSYRASWSTWCVVNTVIAAFPSNSCVALACWWAVNLLCCRSGSDSGFRARSQGSRRISWWMPCDADENNRPHRQRQHAVHDVGAGGDVPARARTCWKALGGPHMSCSTRAPTSSFCRIPARPQISMTLSGEDFANSLPIRRACACREIARCVVYRRWLTARSDLCADQARSLNVCRVCDKRARDSPRRSSG